MTNWTSIFGDRILDLAYEETVSDLEKQSRDMLGFLDLPYQAEVLNYHQAEGLVKTPSASQVREPIYRDSVMAWRKYEKWLDPLVKSLGSS